MNEIGRENNEIERLLQRAKLPEPGNELRERVVSAARQAWDQTTADIPWQVPLRRLAISAAAAVLMVSLANYLGDHVHADPQSRESAAAIEETSDPGDWPEIPSNPLARHLAMINKSSGRNLATLLEYIEKVRDALDESDAGETPDTGAPVEYKSRLLPAPLSFYS